ncbi:MAG: class I SAM-dependent methyltransferase [Deltaproteobacteria bacterium]|nr:class I SAM-dependent methyltransferase [Deltaproteobacteria bacterium]
MQIDTVTRYAFKPFIGSSHNWAMRHCASISAPAKILDVGPGSAMLGKRLQERGGYDLYALEVYEPAIEYLRTIYARVEHSLTPFQDERFDLILLLDVIEHMTHPFEFFKEAAALLKPGGVLLLSVPNIAHWTVRLALLCGCFPYAPRGILDSTHYQFFNRRRFNALLADTPELMVVRKEASIEPLELLLPTMLWDNCVFRAIAKLRLKAANFWPGPLAYQHLAVLKRRD